MARPYRLTPGRRAAILKAQKASARKRKRNRNIKIGVVAAGATAALVGAGVYRHKKSGSSLTVRTLHGPSGGKITGTVVGGPIGINTETRLKKWGNSVITRPSTVRRAVIGTTVGSQRRTPSGISFSRSAIRNGSPVVKGSKVWLSGEKVSHHRYHATVGGFGKAWEVTYTHANYHAPWNRKTHLGMPTMPNPPRPTRKPDPTVPFYTGKAASWPRGYINPNSKKNKQKLKTARAGIYEVKVISKAKKKRK